MSVKTTNITRVIDALKKAGITNPYSISGILAIISKESGFIPQSEKAYSGTSNSRIREIFSKTRELSDQELTALKRDPVKFFDFVYGGRYGNAPNEGYKYRGRGFNQLTFKDNYAAYGKMIGLDLVKNPDLVNDPDTAARVVAAYMQNQFKKFPELFYSRYGARHINDFNDTTTAVGAFYNANAGMGKDTRAVKTSGKDQAMAKVNSIYRITSEYLNSPGGKIASALALLTTGLILYRYS